MSTDSSKEFNHLELASKIDDLHGAILSKHPMMPTLLRDIWKTLQQYPEQVTLLNEEQIQKIVSGLGVQTGVELAKAAIKSPSASRLVKNKIATLGADAF